MNKFKVGDKVRIVKAEYDGGESRMQLQHLVGTVQTISRVLENCRTAPYRLEYDPSTGWDEYELELVTKGEDMFEAGQVLECDGRDYDRVVEGVIGNIVFTRDTDDDTIRYQLNTHLKGEGWKLKTET